MGMAVAPSLASRATAADQSGISPRSLSALFRNFPSLGNSFSASRIRTSPSSDLPQKSHSPKDPRRTSEMDDAVKIFDSMVSMGYEHDGVSYTVLINGYCKCRKMEEAMGLYNKMVQTGFKPTIITYTTILGGLCQDGRLLDARRFLNDMQAQGPSPDIFTYNICLDSLCKQYCLRKAIEVMESIDWIDIKPDPVTYSIIINALCKEGKLYEANELLSQIEEMGFEASSAMFNIMFRGLCQNNEIAKAMKLFHKMAERDLLPDASTVSLIVDLIPQDENYQNFIESLPSFSRKGQERGDGLNVEVLLQPLKDHFSCENHGINKHYERKPIG